ncbi:MAG: hypothetical protein NTU95_04595 [Methanothrix sp.]|nr:hypothetical protein [Methanothrix sp.]
MMTMRVILSIAFIVLFFVFSALGNADALAAQNGSVPQNDSASQAGPSTSSITALFVIVLILVLFATIPLLLNMHLAHKHLERTDAVLGVFLEKHHEELDGNTALQIIKEYINAEPGGAPGTTRGIMAIAIILIVGICLFFLMVYPSDLSSNGIVKDVILTLTGALTSIVGFYFGGKGSTEAKASELKPSEPIKPNAPGSVPTPQIKPERYRIKEGFSYLDKQYPAGTVMDLADIPEETRKEWVKINRIEFYVGDEVKDIQKELIQEDSKPKPGWYRIKSNFRYNDDRHIAGNIINLNHISAKLLAGWEKRGWIEPYSGSLAAPGPGNV